MNLRLTLSLALLLTFALTASAGVAELRLKDQEPALVAAHRGASAIAPENTTASIARAVEAKADLIEFDVRATTDGKLLLFHDKSLERYGGVFVRREQGWHEVQVVVRFWIVAAVGAMASLALLKVR